MEKKLKVKEMLAYGYVRLENDKLYIFDYDVKGDEGLGVLVPQEEGEDFVYTIKDIKYNEEGEVAEITLFS